MTSRGKLALGFGLLTLAGAMVGVIRERKDEERQLTAHPVAKPRDLAPKDAKRAHGMSVAEFKALMERAHAGMDISEQLEDAVEEAIDVTKLPLGERKERLERALAAHRREAWDGSWAAATEDRLARSFEMVGNESVFEVAKVECRTTSCLVTLSWPDHDMGQSVYDRVVSTPVGLGCRLELLPPERGAREATAYLDCAQQKRRSERAVPMVATIRGPKPMPHRGSND